MQRFTFRATARPGDSTSNLKSSEIPPQPRGLTTRLLAAIGNQRLTNWIACLFLAGFLSPANAASVKLAWDRNPESNIVGYEVYYGTAPGIYPNTVDAGNDTKVSVQNLQEGATYYFVVVARNKAGLISPKSNPVSYEIPSIAVEAPKGTITSPDSTISIEAGEKVTFKGIGVDPNGKGPLTYRWDFGRESGIPASTDRNPPPRTFNEPGTYTVTFTVTNSLGVSDPTPAVKTVIVRPPQAVAISQKLWKLEYVDSQEATGYAATNAFDDNPGTFWHTQFTQAVTYTEPHEIQIDMGKASMVCGFEYLSRQDGISVGNIGRYKFYVSTDGKNWGNPVATGTFDSSATQKEVYFKAKKGRYVRLRSITEVNGYTHSNVAELRVLKPAKPKSAAASSVSVQQTAPVKATSVQPVAGRVPATSATANPAGTETGKTHSPTLTTEVIDGKKYLALTLSKPLVPDGVKRTVQVSPNLLDWFSGGKHTTVVIDNEAILKVRDNTPVTRHEKRFIRLKETGP